MKTRLQTVICVPALIILALCCCRDEPEPPAPTRRLEPSLRLMTWNIAHGRGLQLFQIALPREKFEKNISHIASVIEREKPHITAFQEADGPSVWSGGFDHVERLATLTGTGHWYRAGHVTPCIGPLKGSYGTALMSVFPMADRRSHVFPFEPEHYRKGFATATIAWPRLPEGIDVVSVHLDSADASVRKRQAGEMISVLGKRSRPLIVMGDMNCSWTAKEKTLRLLCRELNLTAFAPEAQGMATYPSTRPRVRIDWILISGELRFVSYGVLPDVASDHLAVVAEVEVNH